MSDPNLLEALKQKEMFQQPALDQSWAMAILGQPGTGLSAEQLVLAENEPYSLLPLEQLYLEQKAASQAAMQGLVSSIEFILALEDHQSGHGLSDADAVSALEKLALKPEPPQSELAGTLQAILRLELSLRDFTRGDVRQALRNVLRAAQKGVKKGTGRTFLGQIHHWIH